jgi:hypothetical protein
MAGKHWLSREDEHLRQNIGKTDVLTIAKRLGRTETAVYKRAFKLGLLKQFSHRWTSQDIKTLVDNYSRTRTKELATLLHRDSKAIHHKAQQLHLSKKLTEELNQRILVLTKEGTPQSVIASEIGCSPYQIRQVLKKYGVKPSTKSGIKSGFSLLKDFKYAGKGAASYHRAALLYMYNYTCWDCHAVFPAIDLDIHHDLTELPVKVLVLCRACHGKRHGRKFAFISKHAP